jgi:hypothetical protein
MSQPTQSRSRVTARVESNRVRLARAALAAALDMPGVRRGDPGRTGVHATGVPGGERLDGVLCTAAPGQGYTVSLQLVCEPVPLRPLGKRIQTAVMAAAAKERLAGAVASVDVRFNDLADSDAD